MHTVEQDFEVLMGVEEVTDKIKVEDLFHEVDVVGDRVDNFDLEGTIAASADLSDINVWDLGNLVGSQSLRGFVDLVGDGLGSGGAIGKVVFDTEILGRTC